MLEKNGLVKLVEECGELTQVAAKKMTRMDSDEHWDGAGSLAVRLQDEMGDVIGAAQVVAENFGLDWNAVMRRASAKNALFRQWMSEATDAAVVKTTECPYCQDETPDTAKDEEEITCEKCGCVFRLEGGMAEPIIIKAPDDFHRA